MQNPEKRPINWREMPVIGWIIGLMDMLSEENLKKAGVSFEGPIDTQARED